MDRAGELAVLSHEVAPSAELVKRIHKHRAASLRALADTLSKQRAYLREQRSAVRAETVALASENKASAARTAPPEAHGRFFPAPGERRVSFNVGGEVHEVRA